CSCWPWAASGCCANTRSAGWRRYGVPADITLTGSVPESQEIPVEQERDESKGGQRHRGIAHSSRERPIAARPGENREDRQGRRQCGGQERNHKQGVHRGNGPWRKPLCVTLKRQGESNQKEQVEARNNGC